MFLFLQSQWRQHQTNKCLENHSGNTIIIYRRDSNVLTQCLAKGKCYVKPLINTVSLMLIQQHFASFGATKNKLN